MGLYKMRESSPILPTVHENQTEIHDEDNEKEVSVTIIPKVAFTTTGASLHQDVEKSNKEESESKPTFSPKNQKCTC